MERFTIGRCRSGKIITSHPDLDGLTTIEEIFDAYAVLSVLVLREKRRDQTSELALHLQLEFERLEREIDQTGNIEELMRKIGARTSIDIRHYGIRLVSPEFRE